MTVLLAVLVFSNKQIMVFTICCDCIEASEILVFPLKCFRLPFWLSFVSCFVAIGRCLDDQYYLIVNLSFGRRVDGLLISWLACGRPSGTLLTDTMLKGVNHPCPQLPQPQLP